MKILIVEDEPKTAAFVQRGFAEEGFVVDVATDGADGLHLATTGDYDAIVLDVMLPQRDGWSVLQAIREHRPDQPVILLTALDAVSHRVKGLTAGADDYLVKPFAFSELHARVRNLLRRTPVRRAEELNYDDLEMDRARHRAARSGQPIDLAPQEYRLLEYLLRHPGEVLTRTRLAEQVWDMNFDGDSNVVDVAVRRLRRKVDDPFEHKLIHTIRGVGYVLERRD
ncbi:heavy metal response regulator transcription factor [Thiobacillus sp. 0-1251]|uniref:heavy metal response regulator transcription factor n=1 Tax=Thiobacillus sp. 0-1251 TaxID=1895858 RepID=UPI00095C962E|nr:heavy metal response regulator transcription factor [Thiobacillus sp. 0-1251]OJY58423.1 MAG: DNA-binding response regulator [Thiobacillus sp. 0-1251]